MAGAKNHDYHILPPSITPLVGSFAALVMFFGMVMMFQPKVLGNYGSLVFGAGLIGVLYTFWTWWADVIREAHAGDHTPVVQLHLRYGMILFIASEVMFFVGWFWAFFELALFHEHRAAWYVPAWDESVAAAWANWPPPNVEQFDPFHLPLMNTLVLLLSGTTVTWAHHALQQGDRNGAKLGLALTVILGVSFTALQVYEYSHAAFHFGDPNDGANLYGASFFMATGFHGFHVVVGTIFLAVCLWRLMAGGFTPQKHFGFEAAAWYWHFVDVVWLFLFAFVYVVPWMAAAS